MPRPLPATYADLDAGRRRRGVLAAAGSLQTRGATAMPPNARWAKHPSNPVLGGQLGTCFDVCLLREDGVYRMWFSWRPRRSVALVESADGVHWGEPRVVLEPTDSGWEDEVNRAVVVPGPQGYHMWYTGQTRERSGLGYAVSTDGLQWRRRSPEPVLAPEEPWEGTAVMCPHVLYDEASGLWRMWYSGGEQYEPDAILPGACRSRS